MARMIPPDAMLKTDLFVLSGLYENAWQLATAAGIKWPTIKDDLLITLDQISGVNDEEEIAQLVNLILEQITLTVPGWSPKCWAISTLTGSVAVRTGPWN